MRRTKQKRGSLVAEVFLDTETTGLHRGYRAWEIAMIRRDRDGAEASITIFVDKDDLDLANADPRGLAIGGFEQRHPSFGWPLQAGQIYVGERDAAHLVQQFTEAALVFGVNPSYDTIGLDGLLARQGLAPTWFYVPQDIATMAYGFMLRTDAHPLPRQAERLSVAERHTAMGDALWVRRWYDKLHEHALVDVVA
jgi:hypothetical protein